MRDRLHDKIDAREQLAAEAAERVEQIVKESFAEVFEAAGGDIRKTLEALAVLVEDELLTEMTTKAVRAGADGARAVRG